MDPTFSPWEWLALACGAVIVLCQWWQDRRFRLDTVSRNNPHYRHHWR